MEKASTLCKRITWGLTSIMTVALLAGCGAKEAATENKTGKVEIEFFQQKTEAVDT